MKLVSARAGWSGVAAVRALAGTRPHRSAVRSALLALRHQVPVPWLEQVHAHADDCGLQAGGLGRRQAQGDASRVTVCR